MKLPSRAFAALFAGLLANNALAEDGAPSQPAPPVSAQTVEIARTALQRLAPEAKIEQISTSPIQGWLQLVVDGKLLYLSEDGRHLLQGSLIDTASAVNLSELARDQLRQQAIVGLPESTTIRFAPSSPQHEITVFTAIDCSYCRRFHQNIERYLEAGIAVNYVLIPLAGPGSLAERLSQQVHCAADRPSAFTAATLGQALEERAECPSGFRAGVDLATRLGIRNTPTLIGSRGEMLGGYLTAEDLLAKLEPGATEDFSSLDHSVRHAEHVVRRL